MSGQRCQIGLVAGCICLFLPLVMFCLLSFLIIHSERKRIDDYVQTDCFVTNSSLKKCGVIQTEQDEKQCFRLTWRIEYVKYQNGKRTMITRLEFYLKSETYRKDELRKELRKYQIGQIYQCYHSRTDRLIEVQWEEPSRKRYIRYMIYASVSLFILICFIMCFIYHFVKNIRSARNERQNLHCSPDSRTQAVDRRDLPLIPSLLCVLPTTPREEEHFALNSQPPTYISPSTSVEEGENIPLTPLPPPYVTPSVSIENENIPLTPPPTYVPSIV